MVITGSDSARGKRKRATCVKSSDFALSSHLAYGVDCQQHRHKCNDDAWRSLLSQACPRTCGLCHHGACRDQMDGCCAMRHLCRDFAYRSFMTLNCGKTCGVCDDNVAGTLAGANTATGASSAQVSASIHHIAQGKADLAVSTAMFHLALLSSISLRYIPCFYPSSGTGYSYFRCADDF